MAGDVDHCPSVQEGLNYLVASHKTTPVMVRGKGIEVEDEEGRKYFDLDGGPGVLATGHCHPKVVGAIQKQAETMMQAPGRFHSRLAMGLAKRISELTNGKQRRVFFVNSGAEANDGAVKLAMKFATVSGKRGYGILALEHGFHGRLSLPLALTGLPGLKRGFGPYASFPGVVHVTPPYFYRCRFGSRTLEECGARAVQAVRDAIRFRAPGEFAMMIAEPIIGNSGVIVPPDNYWPQVAEICLENKILLIADEVFVGMGRTGRAFAHQHWGISPSIVTFAKAIGGGLPLGGFIATDEVAKAFESNDHNTTFGSNNQVGLAAGHAVLDVIEEEKLIERAAGAGDRMLEGFRRLQAQFPYIGDVRGKGLVIGIEVVRDREGKEPAANLAKVVQDNLLKCGVIIGVGGVFGNVLRMSPALTISDAEIDHVMELFRRGLAMSG